LKTWILLLIALAALAALSTYSAMVGPGRVDTVRELVRQPGQVIGQQVALESNVRVVSHDADTLLLRQGGEQIRARIPVRLKSRWDEDRAEIEPREFISLRGRVIAGPAIEIEEYHLHKDRSFKIWLSLASLLVLVAVVILEWWQERSRA